MKLVFGNDASLHKTREVRDLVDQSLLLLPTYSLASMMNPVEEVFFQKLNSAQERFY